MQRIILSISTETQDPLQHLIYKHELQHGHAQQCRLDIAVHSKVAKVGRQATSLDSLMSVRLSECPRMTHSRPRSFRMSALQILGALVLGASHACHVHLLCLESCSRAVPGKTAGPSVKRSVRKLNYRKSLFLAKCGYSVTHFKLHPPDIGKSSYSLLGFQELGIKCFGKGAHSSRGLRSAT